MKNEELHSPKKEALKAKEKQRKGIIGIFMTLMLALLFFFIRDMIFGKGMDLPVFIVIVTSLAVLLSIFEDDKGLAEELARRNTT